MVIPAIDLKGGRCVRLRQGRMAEETVFSDVPEEMAIRWYQAGAERLHLVDLDGAAQGKPVNGEAIRRIVGAVPIPIELGGGVRDITTVEEYLDLGLDYIILGTVAYKNPELVHKACRSFPGKVILGIDGRGGRVAVEGWTEEVALTPAEMAKRYEEAGIAAVIYTDIEKDGMRTGPNVDATRALARSLRVPVIASGGIFDLSDVIRLCSLAGDGVIGMITGRALYDGSLDLAAAVKVSREKNMPEISS